METGFNDPLAALLGALQSRQFTSPTTVKYIRSDQSGMRTTFHMSRLLNGRQFAARSDNGSEAIAYDVVDGLLTADLSGETQRLENYPFPISPPMLTLLAPVFLPIWGGDRSFYSPHEIQWATSETIKISFGDPGSTTERGFAEINISDGFVQVLLLNGTRYSIT